MLDHEAATGPAHDAGVAAIRANPGLNEQAKWEARHELARHRAETDRLRVLVDFLSHPIHAHGGPDPDPDIVTAYNLAVEAALHGIRRSASGTIRDDAD